MLTPYHIPHGDFSTSNQYNNTKTLILFVLKFNSLLYLRLAYILEDGEK